MRLGMGVMIAVAFVAVAVLSMQLRTELRALQQEPVDSLQWNVTQLELDVVRLEAAATLALAQPETDLADLRKRYDLSSAGRERSGKERCSHGLACRIPCAL
jgi:hypothetical protein